MAYKVMSRLRSYGLYSYGPYSHGLHRPSALACRRAGVSLRSVCMASCIRACLCTRVLACLGQRYGRAGRPCVRACVRACVQVNGEAMPSSQGAEHIIHKCLGEIKQRDETIVITFGVRTHARTHACAHVHGMHTCTRTHALAAVRKKKYFPSAQCWYMLVSNFDRRSAND